MKNGKILKIGSKIESWKKFKNRGEIVDQEKVKNSKYFKSKVLSKLNIKINIRLVE